MVRHTATSMVDHERRMEKAAKACYEQFNKDLIGTHEPAWERLPEPFKERLRSATRAAIEAYDNG